MNKKGKPATSRGRDVGRPADRRTTGLEARARLLEATTKLLSRNGLAATSARDIARESGQNLAAIGYYFGSKDDLIAEALLGAIREWLDPALEVLRRDMDPLERMILAVQALQGSFERARRSVPAYLEALVQAHRPGPLRDPARRLFREVHGFIATQIQELQDSGYLPAWVDPAAMATLQMAAANGIALQSVVTPGLVNHQAVASQAMQLLVAARGQA